MMIKTLTTCEIKNLERLQMVFDINMNEFDEFSNKLI